MVRDVGTNRRMACTATLAIMVGGAALLWHLLACTESPMAYSPNGKDLAFVTMEPYNYQEEIGVAGQHVFRMMVLSEGKALHVLEETTSCMLSAPAYSPDGKRLCYLRIPLTKNDEGGNPAEPERSMERAPNCPGSQASPAAQGETPATAPSTGPRKAPEPTDHALPRLQTLASSLERTQAVTRLRATLVTRDADNGGIISTTPLELPVLHDMSHTKAGLFITYTTAQPQYSPERGWVYMCVGDVVAAVDPSNGRTRIVAAPAYAARLSPDGKTLAFLQEGALGLAGTNGERTVYRRWSLPISLAGLAWVDKQTVVVLQPNQGDDAESVLHFFDTSGTLRKSVPFRLPKHAKHEEDNVGQLAATPDGKCFALAFRNDVFFLKADGKVTAHWHKDHELLAQPVFSPDGKRVAFKVMRTEEADGYARAAAIAFFTLDGAEVWRVPIPKINPAATQPAAQPASQPAAGH